jgi:hypothetical protein
MHRRVRNVLLFVGFLVGTGLLLGGVMALREDNRAGWLYLVGACAAFIFAFVPGRRLRDSVLPPDT